MYKISSMIIFGILLISTILTFVHSADQTPNLDICSISLCAEIKTCPPGTYLSVARPSEGLCCDLCEPFAKLGEHCNETIRCHQNLICPLSLNGLFTSESVCTFFWENTPPKCDTTYCPIYDSCPNGTTLIRHNGDTVCCDQCVDNAKYGEYCDNTLPCIDGLPCTNHICTESDLCIKEQQLCAVINDCDSQNGYILEANGLNRCCDTCRTYSKLGEECDPKTKWCDSNTYCDSYSNTCAKSQIACSCIEAFESDCVNGVWIPAGENVCCGYCKLFANYGEFCNDETPCISKFVCNTNNTCDLTNQCNCQ